MTSVTLQSDDHRQLLDVIDSLRSKGLSRYVDLPEIVVCGDQSSGKSSVLEAISGMSFPTKDNLCTRFATELVLRRDAATKVEVSIAAGQDRTESERERLAKVHFDFDIARPDLSAVVERAKEAMGLSEDKVFSTDILRVEVCSPDQPHLTMVDLPGLFRAGNKDQSVADAATVRRLVESYMRRPRSIILAVVSAKSDFALQDVTEIARKLDPAGLRTLGLITKPDTLSVGSESEISYVRLAENRDVVLSLGWHVVKNRSFETKDISPSERDAQETAFFSQGVWTRLNPAYIGVKALRSRLSDVLKDQILRQLPSLRKDVESSLAACQSRLRRLGPSRATPEDQYRYLLLFSHDFSVTLRSALDGMYNKAFFGSAKTRDGYVKRLRAVVQNLLTDFAESIRLEGEARKIVDIEESREKLGPNAVSRRDYVDEVKELMRKNRGCELPGTFNPLVVGELFVEQCQPWRDQVARAKNRIFEAASDTMVSIVNEVAADETADRLIHLIGLRMDVLKHDLDRRLDRLLQPHFEIHPITYNHYLTENVQKAQSSRRRRRLETILRTAFGNLKDPIYSGHSPTYLLDLLDDGHEADMETHASTLAVDYMQAYYKVALKRFIDDFSVLGIEQCLIQKMSSLFTPEVVQAMSTKEILSVAAESPETDVDRQKCNERLSVLETGLRDLKILDKRRPGSGNDEPQDSTEQSKDGALEGLNSDAPCLVSERPSTLHDTALEEVVDGFDVASAPIKKFKKARRKYNDEQSFP